MACINKFSIIIAATMLIVVATTSPTSSGESNGTSSNNGNSNKQAKDASSSGSAAAAAAAASGCFASDTLVKLYNGKSIPIGQLQPGDRLLTSDGSTIFTTQMMMMLDKNQLQQTMFYTITTTSGHYLSLTPLHLLAVVQHNGITSYIPAKEVNIGDGIYVVSDDQLQLSPVKNITMEIKTGFYAPLTTSGTLLVNDIMASCYSNIESHESAHFYMGILRFYYWLGQSLSINKPFGTQTIDGIHIIPQTMYNVIQFLYPSALRSS